MLEGISTTFDKSSYSITRKTISEEVNPEGNEYRNEYKV